MLYCICINHSLAKLHHPDASKSSHSMDKFRLICSSYEVLKNERTRADYLLEKNGHDWDKKGSNKFNDVRSDYAKAKREATKQSE
jgi:DnaJ-class molecular chaperone